MSVGAARLAPWAARSSWAGEGDETSPRRSSTPSRPAGTSEVTPRSDEMAVGKDAELAKDRRFGVAARCTLLRPTSRCARMISARARARVESAQERQRPRRLVGGGRPRSNPAAPGRVCSSRHLDAVIVQWPAWLRPNDRPQGVGLVRTNTRVSAPPNPNRRPPPPQGGVGSSFQTSPNRAGSLCVPGAIAQPVRAQH